MSISRRGFIIGLTLFMAGCATSQYASYGPVPGERFPVAAIPASEIRPELRRSEVAFGGDYPASTIVVNTPERRLYYVLGNGRAIRYGIGVGEGSPVKTIQELIALGKQRTVTYGSNNVTNVVAMFQLAKLTGASFRWVRFSGGVEAVTQAVGGHVDAVIQTVTEMKPQIEAGKLRFLAAAAVERWPDFPEVKTLREHGYEAVSHGPFGYAFPAGGDREILKRMEAALADVMADKSVTDQIARIGIVPVYRSGAEYRAFLKEIEGNLLPILKETGMAKKSA